MVFFKIIIIVSFFFFFAGVHYIVLTCVKFALSKGVVLLFFLNLKSPILRFQTCFVCSVLIPFKIVLTIVCCREVTVRNLYFK